MIEKKRKEKGEAEMAEEGRSEETRRRWWGLLKEAKIRG